jgi:RND family efflux transporter MFP subunit
MTEDRGPLVGPFAIAAIVTAALAAGAGATYLFMRGGSTTVLHDAHGAADAPAPEPLRQTPGVPAPAPSTPTAVEPLPDVVVTLSKDAVDRAGIVIAPVAAQTITDALRVPGVVEPNAYRLVSVTPLVGGRLVRVSVQLGDRVKRGQAIAELYSPELAEARTKYVAARAMLDAHDRELQRTQKLVEIGAASRQELERAHAEHAAQTAAVESARSQLELLGVETDAAPSSKAAAATTILAPIDGVVTERLANVGLNVDPASKLFTIVDLSTVWIIADVYERDLRRVRVGDGATVTTTAYPDMSLKARVSYVDPQLNVDTRTAKVRVEVANPRQDLRLGMYTDVALAATPAAVLAVPASAIQSVGGHQVVYIPVPGEAAFIERDVRLGHAYGNAVEVLSGLAEGDAVVAKGSFFVRAEAERLGLRAQAAPAREPSSAAASTISSDGRTQTARVLVNEKGYEPARVSLRAGVPARLIFVRTTDKTCGTEIVFPSLDIRRPLPLDEPVAIEFTPAQAGEIAFVCGMNMLKGVVIVQ